MIDDQAESERARQDMLIYGTGMIHNGRRVPPEEWINLGANLPGDLWPHDEPRWLAIDRTTSTQVNMIIDELQRRGVEAPGISEAERERRQRAWDRNPPCPKCGSYEHFEC